MKYILALATLVCGSGTVYFIRLALANGDIIALIIFAGIMTLATIASGLWTLTYFKRF